MVQGLLEYPSISQTQLLINPSLRLLWAVQVQPVERIILGILGSFLAEILQKSLKKRIIIYVSIFR